VGWRSESCPGGIILGPKQQIEAERLKLPTPFSGIVEPLDADAAGQAAPYRCSDKIGCEEGERDGHVDLPTTARECKVCDRGYST
jgi:hypothetical protein